ERELAEVRPVAHIVKIDSHELVTLAQDGCLLHECRQALRHGIRAVHYVHFTLDRQLGSVWKEERLGMMLPALVVDVEQAYCAGEDIELVVHRWFAIWTRQEF